MTARAGWPMPHLPATLAPRHPTSSHRLLRGMRIQPCLLLGCGITHRGLWRLLSPLGR